MTQRDSQDYQYIIQPRRIDREDIEQEALLYELEHPDHNASRALIAKRLAAQEPAATFQGDPTLVGLPMIETAPLTVNTHALQMITEWARDKGHDLQSAIYSYLEDPTEEAFQSTVRELRRAGFLDPGFFTSTEISFAEGLNQVLSDGLPHSLEELYRWARQFHQARRPEATLRQALRRLERKGLLLRNGDYCQLKHSS